MADTDPAIVARKACGCVIAAFVDLPEYRESHAESIAGFVRRGYAVEHVTVDEARAIPWARGGGLCDHDAERLAKLRGST